MSGESSLVVSGWSAVSPFGLGADAFAAGVRTRTVTAAPPDRERWPGPAAAACLVPGFDIRAQLGPKGTRSMDRATALAVIGVGMVLDGVALPAAETALVLGTTTGSVRSMIGFTRDSLTGRQPFDVDPAQFPNTVMNRAAGQSAIWHGLKGPNTTLAGGLPTVLLALNYARRLYRAGRASAVLCGAVEEYSSEREWLEWHNGGARQSAPLGEGCVIFLLEPEARALARGRTPLADVHPARFGAFATPAAAREVLRDRIVAALADAGAAGEEVRSVAPHGGDDDYGTAELAALRDVFGDVEAVSCGDLIGETASVSAGFQLATLLATGAGTTGVVTSVDRDGVAGATVVRVR